MKLSSSTFCCYCHCWLMMLLIVSSVVHVSPEISKTTNKKYTQVFNSNYYYQNKMSEFLQLNKNMPNKSKTTIEIASTLPKLSQPTTSTTTKATTSDNHYTQNYMKSHPTLEDKRITTVATIQRKSTMSTTVVAPQAKSVTLIPTAEQLHVTKQPTLHPTTIAGRRISNEKMQQHAKESIFYKFDNSIEEVAAPSRTTMTRNYAADNSNVSMSPTIMKTALTTNPFVQAATIAMNKQQTNDYSSSNYNSRNSIEKIIPIDLNPHLRQQHNDSTNSKRKLKNSKRSNDITNVSYKNHKNNSKQKTTNTFNLNHHYRYRTINNSRKINTTTIATKHKQQKYLTISIENETTQNTTTVNSLTSKSTTDSSETSRSRNFKSHNSSNCSYNYIGASTDSVRNLSLREITQSLDDSYRVNKPTFTLGTTSSISLQIGTPATYSQYIPERRQHYNQLKRRELLLHRHVRQAASDDEQNEKCRMFIEGDPEKNELYSPEYPNDYPKNINCTRVIIAPKGQIIRLDFRNSFNIEEKEECKFDFLEIRDGQYGFSNLIGKYCGTDFPPEITSKERYLWLHFHSDESIEYSGFTAVYEFIDRNRDAPSTDLNCTIEKDGFEGFVNATDVPKEIKDTVIRNKIPLDCMWRIQVQEKWKIQVKFVDFKLAKPNDCETNFLDIFPEQTVMPLRVKNFCGSAGEGITSDSNILHMRFYAEQIAINSTFSILYTAFRERGSSSCAEDEYDCEDATCIAADLKCNGRSNCKFLWDEEGCEEEDEGQSEHMIIIITVFGLILSGMVITFLVNCIRKIMHDQKIIREHIRQSKESKLNEMGRNSKARSRENISIVSPRQKHSQTSLQILDDVSSRYYREMELHTKSSFKEKDPSILRHDMIVQTSLCSTDDSSTTITDQQPTPPPGVSSNACDMGCQTRESLFATASLLRQKSKTPSLAGSQRTIEGVPPPPRFSTFGYDASKIAPPPPPSVSTLSRRNMHLPQESLEMEKLPQQTTHNMMMMTPHQQQYQHQQQQQHQHLHHRPLQEICHHHHQHQQHLQKQSLPRHNVLQQQQQQNQQPAHNQHQHMQHHHISAATIPPNVTQLPATTGTVVATAISTGSSGRHREQGTGNAASKNKQTKVDDSKVFSDIRNSAPDVIIMTSH